METVLQDFRYGVRSLMKSPSFAAVSTITLALAIGVNTAIFSLVSVVIFSDLPMGDAETVALIRSSNPYVGHEREPLSYPDFVDLQQQASSFEALTAMEGAGWILTGDGAPQRVQGNRVTANLMEVWRLPPAAGRAFLPEEGAPGGPNVVMLSSGFWRRRYGSSPDAIGSSIRLDGIEHTIIGVASPKIEFADLAEADVWAPLQLGTGDRTRDERTLFVAGRLAPGVSGGAAAEEIARLGQRLSEAYPENEDWEYRSQLVREGLIDDEAKLILTLLVLSVGFVLLIACANVANMLLARATTRSREMAVRSALGARRVRLVRQLLTESFIVAAVSALAGLFLARAILNLMVWITAGREEFFIMAEMDEHVLAFTLIVTILAPIIFGLLPALRTSGDDVASTIKEGSVRSGGGRKSARLRSFLAAGQVSLALMAMVLAVLFVRTVMVTEQEEWGMDIEGVMTVQVELPESDYGDDGAIRQFYLDAASRFSSVAGVQAAGFATGRPSVENGPVREFEIEGRVAGHDLERSMADLYSVSPGFLELMGVPLMRGRDIGVQDTEAAVPVVLVSDEAATRFWGDDDPIGQRLRVGAAETDPWLQVVGIVADVRSSGDDLRPEPTLYVPFSQRPARQAILFARTSTEPTGVAPALSAAIWEVDPNLPIDDSRTMERVYRDGQGTTFALLTLFVTFALFALLMSAIGIYGVMSYMVSQRTGEISIRMALGAEIGKVQRMVLWQGGRIVLLGGLLGLAGAALLARAVRSLMFGISTLDPVTFLGVPAVLIVVALIANYVPARRATRIDPMRALRQE
jgi:predicted permease